MPSKTLFLIPVTGLAFFLLLSPCTPDLSYGHGAEQKGKQEQQWTAPPDAANRPNPIHADEDSIERGQRLFKNYCVSCHGKTGSGDGPFAERLITEPPDLTVTARHHTDGNLAWKIGQGKDPMPGWKNILQEKDIWDMVNFIRSISTQAD